MEKKEIVWNNQIDLESGFSSAFNMLSNVTDVIIVHQANLQKWKLANIYVWKTTTHQPQAILARKCISRQQICQISREEKY